MITVLILVRTQRTVVRDWWLLVLLLYFFLVLLSRVVMDPGIPAWQNAQAQTLFCLTDCYSLVP